MRRAHDYLVLATRLRRSPLRRDLRLHAGLLELAARARSAATPMTDGPVLYRHDCPFCGAHHEGEFIEDVEAAVLACRDTHPTSCGSLENWTKTPGATWPTIITPEMEASEWGRGLYT